MKKTTQQQGSSIQYGLVLKRILDEHKISISTLARRLELRSRNTVHRILTGNSKLESVEKLHRRICTNQSQLHFRDEDIARLREALDCCRYGEQGYAVQKTLMDLIIRSEHSIPTVPCICCASTEPAWCGRLIEDVIASLADYSEVDILLLNSVYPALLAVLHQLLSGAEKRGQQLRIRHILGSTGDVLAEMQQFMQIQMFLTDPHYTCYRAGAGKSDENKVSSGEQTMIVGKRSSSGLRTVDRISFFSHRAFAYCAGLSDPDGRLAEYFAAYGQMLIAGCSCFNPCLTPAQEISALLSRNAEFAQYERCWSQILIKPDLCVSQIPTEYMMRLIRDGGYLGLSPDAPEIEEFECIHRKRYENFISGKHGYVFILSMSGMRRFMETGRLSDHVPGLPAFTPEERRAIVEGLLRVAREKAGVIFRAFRNDTVYSGVGLSLFNDKMLYISGPDQTGGEMTVFQVTDRAYLQQLRTIIRKQLFPSWLCEVEETVHWLEALLEEGDDEEIQRNRR